MTARLAGKVALITGTGGGQGSGVWQSGEEFSLAARALKKAGLGASVPKDEESYRLRLAGPPGTFRPYSIHEIFVPT